MYDIAIIGAGVVGALTARALARYELEVCILEKEPDVAMGATKANSAIIHAGFDAKEGTLKAKFNLRGALMMERITRELGVKYQKNGSLVVGFEDERADVEAIYRRGIANGVTGLRLIEKEELHELEPNVNPELTLALYAETGAIVCPYELCIAAVGNAMDNGAKLRLGFNVTKIERMNGGFEIKSEDGRAVRAKYVVNCAGLYANAVAEMTGDGDFKIIPRKGEYMVLDKECGTFTRRTIFHTPTKMGKGILISPTVDGNLIVGPTALDVTDKEDRTTTVSGFEALYKKTAENVADLPFGRVITSFSGLRAVGDTGDFIIRARDGVVTLGGIESPGLTASPAIAEHVVELLAGMGMRTPERENYNPIRKSTHGFKYLSPDEKNERIKADPRYGKIVCRCENVTEGEIVDAIRANPGARDLDGIKRRTRSGMGRCQGGFCAPIVTAILAKELAVPFESVTKTGGASVLNFSKIKGDK